MIATGLIALSYLLAFAAGYALRAFASLRRRHHRARLGR